MREKILPVTPVTDWETSHKQSLEHDRESHYYHVISGESNYENIAVSAFEVVEDHIYDRPQVSGRESSSMIYQMTATDAHVKAATQIYNIALSQNQRQPPQVHHHNDSLNHKAGGQRHHSDKDSGHNQTTGQTVALSPATASVPSKVSKETDISMLYSKPSKRPVAAPSPLAKPSKQDPPPVHPRVKPRKCHAIGSSSQAQAGVELSSKSSSSCSRSATSRL